MDSDTRSTGLQGEELASCYLVKKGYTILCRNWRAKSVNYELDIVARQGSTVVFFEVKTDRTGKFGPSITWVTPLKMKRIAKAAKDFIANNVLENCSFRFDVIGIETREGKSKINHLENAFMAPEDT